VSYGRSQLNVAHPLAANLGLNHLDAAFLAHHAPVLHPFVFAAVAFIIFDRAEYSGAEKPVALGLERAIIDCLRFLDLSIRPFPDSFGRRNHNFDRVEVQRIFWLSKQRVKFFQGNLLSVAQPNTV
jgi:hypothetical protein